VATRGLVHGESPIYQYHRRLDTSHLTGADLPETHGIPVANLSPWNSRVSPTSRTHAMSSSCSDNFAAALKQRDGCALTRCGEVPAAWAQARPSPGVGGRRTIVTRVLLCRMSALNSEFTPTAQPIEAEPFKMLMRNRVFQDTVPYVNSRVEAKPMTENGKPVRVAINIMRARLTVVAFSLAIVSLQLAVLPSPQPVAQGQTCGPRY
jgi:hypothetical protein